MPNLTPKESKAARAKLATYRQAVNRHGAAKATKVYNRQVAGGVGSANKASAKAMGTMAMKPSGPAKPRNASDVAGRKMNPGGTKPQRGQSKPTPRPTPTTKKTTASKQQAVNKARPKPPSAEAQNLTASFTPKANPTNPSARPPAKKKASPRPKPKPKAKSSKSSGEPRSIAAAKKAGKSYFIGKDGKKKAAVTAGDLKKSGHKSLRAYLNAQRKKKK